jgi:hypothetical protein
MVNDVADDRPKSEEPNIVVFCGSTPNPDLEVLILECAVESRPSFHQLIGVINPKIKISA